MDTTTDHFTPLALRVRGKNKETRDELQLPAILCQDAYQRLMLHPYITASRTIINIVLSLCSIQALDTKRPVASLVKGGLLPARASEQGNVIGSVRIYIYMCVQNFFVIERTRDLIHLKFVATDFFPKIISPSAGENSGDLA